MGMFGAPSNLYLIIFIFIDPNKSSINLYSGRRHAVTRRPWRRRFILK
jgi:hypothetical protein